MELLAPGFAGQRRPTTDLVVRGFVLTRGSCQGPVRWGRARAGLARAAEEFRVSASHVYCSETKVACGSSILPGNHYLATWVPLQKQDFGSSVVGRQLATLSTMAVSKAIRPGSQSAAPWAEVARTEGVLAVRLPGARGERRRADGPLGFPALSAPGCRRRAASCPDSATDATGSRTNPRISKAHSAIQLRIETQSRAKQPQATRPNPSDLSRCTARGSRHSTSSEPSKFSPSHLERENFAFLSPSLSGDRRWVSPVASPFSKREWRGR